MQQLHLHSRLQLAVEHAHVRDDALVSVEIGIEAQRLQRRRARRLRRRNALDDRLQNFINANPLLGAGQNRRVARNGQNVLQLFPGLRDIRMRQVNFVDDGDDGEILLHRQVHVGDRLRLDALRRVNDEQRAFARAQAARHFVGKIHVPRRINQVQLVSLAVFGLVTHRDRMRLDGDAAFLLEIHGIEQLRLHVAGGDGAGAMQQAVGKRRLPMVNMGDDAEIADMRCVHPCFLIVILIVIAVSNFKLRIRAQQDNRKAGEEKEISLHTKRV